MQDVHVVVPQTALAALLAANMRDKREAANLTVKEAARRAGMHWSFWEKIEKEEGRVRSHMLRRIAEALRVETASLFEELPEVRAAAQGTAGLPYLRIGSMCTCPGGSRRAARGGRSILRRRGCWRSGSRA